MRRRFIFWRANHVCLTVKYGWSLAELGPRQKACTKYVQMGAFADNPQVFIGQWPNFYHQWISPKCIKRAKKIKIPSKICTAYSSLWPHVGPNLLNVTYERIYACRRCCKFLAWLLSAPSAVLADTATKFSRVTDGRLCMKQRVAPVGERSVSFTVVGVRIEGR